MEQTLSMNLSQKLAMTMQMQQAIQLLQMSAQELRAAVEKEYLENPVLEMDESSNGDAPKEEVRAEDISPMADYLENGQPGYFTDDRDGGMEAATPSGPTLEEELLEQVRYAFFDEEERAVATFIVGSIDERGYLIVPVEEIMRAMGASEGKVMEVLHRIQEFEPSGIGARDLQECLRIQARQRGIYEGLVAALIDRHLDEVAASRVKSIAEAEQASPEDVQLAIDILRTLDPKPGRAYGLASSHYVQPDVFVRKVDGDYVVSISERSMPKLQISSLYRDASGLDETARSYIKQRIHAASWLLRSIEQRRQTICRVMEEIVYQQRPCIEKGMQALRPMSMKQVAEAIHVHESTVSRAVANKYVELPWGVVPMRDFFSSNLGKAASEEEFIAGQVKTAMEELIRGEDAKKPLSDQKLAELLEERGMKVSRRTVMKYREQMGYPSSVKRKRY